METETLKLRNTIQPALIRVAIFRGSILGAMGVALLLFGIFLPVSILKYWGFPLFLAAGGLITWGLLPYRQLRALETMPNELVAIENKYLQYRIKGKNILKIPFQSIRELHYMEKGSTYGIGILLKDPLPEKIVIHDTTFNIDRFQEMSLIKFKSDLFFPYFSKRSFDELWNFWQIEAEAAEK